MTQKNLDFETLTLEYANAVLAKEPGRLAAMYDAEVQVFDAWRQWSYDGLAAWGSNLDAWLGSLGDEILQARFDAVRTSTYEQIGVLTADVTYAAMDGAGVTLRSLQSRLTWVLTRRGEGWAITHQHTSFPVGGDLKAILWRGETTGT